jgi:hypothetical protein
MGRAQGRDGAGDDLTVVVVMVLLAADGFLDAAEKNERPGTDAGPLFLLALQN